MLQILLLDGKSAFSRSLSSESAWLFPAKGIAGLACMTLHLRLMIDTTAPRCHMQAWIHGPRLDQNTSSGMGSPDAYAYTRLCLIMLIHTPFGREETGASMW